MDSCSKYLLGAFLDAKCCENNWKKKSDAQILKNLKYNVIRKIKSCMKVTNVQLKVIFKEVEVCVREIHTMVQECFPFD